MRQSLPRVFTGSQSHEHPLPDTHPHPRLAGEQQEPSAGPAVCTHGLGQGATCHSWGLGGGPPQVQAPRRQLRAHLGSRLPGDPCLGLCVNTDIAPSPSPAPLASSQHGPSGYRYLSPPTPPQNPSTHPTPPHPTLCVWPQSPCDGDACVSPRLPTPMPQDSVFSFLNFIYLFRAGLGWVFTAAQAFLWL